MNLKDATQEWFEMEFDWAKGHPPYSGYWKDRITGKKIYAPRKINYDYFFDKVVGRMGELKLKPNIYRHNTKDVWIFNWYRFGKSQIFTEHNYDLILAGLQAAIAARKAL